MKNSYNNFLKTSDGEQIFYSTNFKPGKAKKHVLIFNYGLVCSNYHWTEQINFFDELGFDILLHDYRGHYQSSGKHDLSKVTFNQIAHDLNELVEFLNLKDVILLGHSMGVNVSLEYAKLFQKKIKAMILISGTIVPVYNIMMNTHFTGPARPFMGQLLQTFPNQFKAFWKFGGWSPITRKIIKSGGFNVDQVSDEFIEIYLNKLGELGPELFFQLLDQMQEHDALAFIHKIKSKTLVIGGNMDKVIPNFLQRLMHSKLENSELYLIHKGSHVPQVDFPENVNERVQLFLNQL
jgi:pimeloyl-ACP methyl ester carboxylesterase